MMMILSFFLLALFLQQSAAFFKTNALSVGTKLARQNGSIVRVQRDDKGYEIKPRDWFNGLSKDPGASLTDPRAVPPECREFAEKIKQNQHLTTMAETIALIDKHYNYFSVPFTCGNIQNPANTNIDAAKILSFALMTKMSEEQALRLFGEAYRNLSSQGTDQANIRSFIQNGWPGVNFASGLAIVSKLQAYDDTDAALATQATIEGKSAAWDMDSDSWIP